MTATQSHNGQTTLGEQTPTTMGHESVAELVKQAGEQVSRLVRQEIRLAVVELKEKARHAGLGMGMAGAASLIALYGLGALLAAAIAALALVLPIWASALIIGAALLLFAALLGLGAKHQVSQAGPPLPQQAIDSSKQDVADIKVRATHR